MVLSVQLFIIDLKSKRVSCRPHLRLLSQKQGHDRLSFIECLLAASIFI